MVKTRFAPSPTGDPHLGGIRTALYNYLFAKHNKGEFFLRIEDTDQKRLVKGAEETILKTLNWLGLSYSGEIVHQSNRLEIYKEYVKKLLDKKIAYEKDGAIWVEMPQNKTFLWTDLVGNKKISFEGKDQKDFVVLKSDGFPTYHLANVIDDHLFDISHVIRGEEWISSVPKHLFLYECFGWKPPFFAHLPVILGPDKGKLSKRHGAKSILDYKKDGFLKEALLNYIALLGWNPGKEQELLSLEEMIRLFDTNDINTSNPKFDFQKLLWMNGVYIRNLTLENLQEKILDFSPEFKKIDKKMLSSFIKIAKSRMSALLEFKDLINPFFNKQEFKLNEKEELTLKILEGKLKNLKIWDRQNILEILKGITKEESIKMSLIYKISIGKERGLPLPESFEIIGKEETLALLKNHR